MGAEGGMGGGCITTGEDGQPQEGSSDWRGMAGGGLGKGAENPLRDNNPPRGQTPPKGTPIPWGGPHSLPPHGCPQPIEPPSLLSLPPQILSHTKAPPPLGPPQPPTTTAAAPPAAGAAPTPPPFLLPLVGCPPVPPGPPALPGLGGHPAAGGGPGLGAPGTFYGASSGPEGGKRDVGGEGRGDSDKVSAGGHRDMGGIWGHGGDMGAWG